jgi:hypothetical protein
VLLSAALALVVGGCSIYLALGRWSMSCAPAAKYDNAVEADDFLRSTLFIRVIPESGENAVP